MKGRDKEGVNMTTPVKNKGEEEREEREEERREVKRKKEKKREEMIMEGKERREEVAQINQAEQGVARRPE